MTVHQKHIDDLIEEKEELEARVDQLEKENRRLTGFTVLFTAFMVFSLLLYIFEKFF
jgi:hypothetical protein